VLILISEKELLVLAHVQRLPLTPNPYAIISNETGISEDEIIAISKNLMQRGIIRRFGASINHRELGFESNPMAVLKVPADMIDMIGEQIASEPGVTHCYSRTGWEYNLFFMTHAKTKEQAIIEAKRIINQTGIGDYKLLFSTRELKKIPFEIARGNKEDST